MPSSIPIGSGDFYFITPAKFVGDSRPIVSDTLKSSLVKFGNQENSFSDSVFVEDFTDTLTRSIEKMKYRGLNESLLSSSITNTSTIRQSWNSIYHESIEYENFDYIDKQELKIKRYNSLKLDVKLPSISKKKIKLKPPPKPKYFQPKTSYTKIIQLPSVTVRLVNEEEDEPLQQDSFDFEEISTSKNYSESIRMNPDELARFKMSEINQRFARDLYFHPQSLSFTPNATTKRHNPNNF